MFFPTQVWTLDTQPTAAPTAAPAAAGRRQLQVYQVAVNTTAGYTTLIKQYKEKKTRGACVDGCTDYTKPNFDSAATTNDRSCRDWIDGCKTVDMFNTNQCKAANGVWGACVCQCTASDLCAEGVTTFTGSKGHCRTAKKTLVLVATETLCLAQDVTNAWATYTCQPEREPADTCIAIVRGCMTVQSLNYDKLANTDDGSCVARVFGCMNKNFLTFSPTANTLCDHALAASLAPDCLVCTDGGCTNEEAMNHDKLAFHDNGKCEFMEKIMVPEVLFASTAAERVPCEPPAYSRYYAQSWH